MHFRRYTKQKADSLQLTGWCFNAPDGSVKGYLEGPPARVEQMTAWLSSEGSPHSRISEFKVTDRRPLEQRSLNSFEVVRPR